ncbi:MAG: hypothetical protein Q8930_04780 [Bacillota bacterium]|nr:hypothetical protein [Bacillota bacterium]
MAEIKNDKNQRGKKLYRDNLILFKKITQYINSSNLKCLEKEEALHQIMDMLLQSQVEHKSADSIIKDYEVFCKSIIEEYTSDKSILYTGLHYLQRSVIAMLFMLVPATILLRVTYPKTATGINTFLLLSATGYGFILMRFTHTEKQKTLASSIYFIVTLLAGSFSTTTQLGPTVDGKLISNTNSILVGMLLLVAAIELYKRLYDMKVH